jgi:hypothetical protein
MILWAVSGLHFDVAHVTHDFRPLTHPWFVLKDQLLQKFPPSLFVVTQKGRPQGDRAGSFSPSSSETLRSLHLD